MAELGIGLIGCGTVGSGVAKLLLEQSGRLASRAGRPLALRRVVVRTLDKPRQVSVPRELYSTDLDSIVRDPSIQVACELVGGIEWARQAVLRLLEAGKDVVTANKALLATHGVEIFAAARRHGRAIAFEASVGGGIPIIAALTQSLAANQIVSLQGILNGTCNFILTSMAEGGLSYAEALSEAQRMGYAEADPTLDVDGSDAAHKLAILAQIAFGMAVPLGAIERRGIDRIDSIDIKFAGELGYTVKLLAETWLHEGQLALHVSPVLLRRHTPLAQVRGAYNAVSVTGDAVGDTLYYGKGAGQMPTASAVAADIIDLAIGRSQRTFQTLRLWAEDGPRLRIRPPATMRTRFYLRVLVDDAPGVLAQVCGALAAEEVSIASVIQHESPDRSEGQRVQLVIMTHNAATGRFRAACDRIDRLGVIGGPCVHYPVED
ncbi:MAG: homoserine dehydrogenase [Gemmataceae bacterium]|nr:homoserine dehydrogenase [Gemmataceae bacterium]